MLMLCSSMKCVIYRK